MTTLRYPEATYVDSLTPSAPRRRRLGASDLCRREFAVLLRLAAPAAAVGLLNMGMSLTDVIMVGWLGADHLAAAALISDTYSVIFYLTGGILGVLAALVAEARGAGRTRSLRRIVRHGLWTAALVAVPAAAAVWHAPALLAAIGVESHLVDLGRPYAQVMAGTAAAMMPVVLWRHVLAACERPRVFMWFTAVALPLNALGNYVLMSGVGGLPKLGLLGVGAASFGVAVLMATGLTLYAALAPGLRDLRLFRRLWAVTPARLVTIVRTGLPIGITSLAEVGVFLTATPFIALLEPELVAAHVITLRTAGVLYSAHVGLSQATTVRVAHAVGAGDHERRRRSMATALATGASIGILYVLALSFGGADTLPLLFLPDAGEQNPAIVALAANLLLLLGLLQIAQGLGQAAIGSLRGHNDNRTPMMLTVASFWIAGFGTGLILALGADLGAVGVWTGILVGTACAATCNGIRLMRIHL